MALYDPIRGEICVRGVFEPKVPFTTNAADVLLVVSALPDSWTKAECHIGGSCVFSPLVAGGGRPSGYFRSTPGVTTLPVSVRLEGGAPNGAVFAICDVVIRLG